MYTGEHCRNSRPFLDWQLLQIIFSFLSLVKHSDPGIFQKLSSRGKMDLNLREGEQNFRNRSISVQAYCEESLELAAVRSPRPIRTTL